MDDTNIKKIAENNSGLPIARFRSSSASIQAAINHPRLSASLSDLSQQSGFQSETRNRSEAKTLFEKRVKRYFYQLTNGCGHENCNYSLCASNQSAPHFSTEVAAAMAVQLASNHSKLLYCPRIVQEPIINKKLASFGQSPLTSPNSSPPSSTSHSRQNSGLIKAFSSPNLLRSDSTQQFVELNSVPTPFLNSLFSFPSFNSLLVDNDGTAGYGNGNLLSDSLNPLHKSRSRSVKVLKNAGEINEHVELMSVNSQVSDVSSEFADASFTSENSIPVSEIEEKIGLKYLSLDLLQIAVDQYQIDSESDPTLLLNTIYGVFSNVETLSKSFLRIDNQKTLPQEERQHPFGLNIPSIEKSYQLIISLNPTSLFQDKLIHATELLLVKLYNILKQSSNLDSSIYRIFLIVILNPLFHEPSHQETMLKRLCCVLGRMRSKCNATWILSLSQLPSRTFSSIVAIFKNYVLSIGPPGNNKPEEAFIGAIKSLSVLCTANELNHRLSIVPYSEFYLNGFISKLNFKEEYKKWRKSLEDNKVTEFSLFNYPFLFDPVAKTRIMHIDAMVKMSLQYEEACVKQALILHTQRFLEDSKAMKIMEDKMKESVNPYLVLEIRRSHFVFDVLQQISQRKSDLKKPLKVKFVGGGEEGMDQGGVQKEFFQILMTELLDPAFGMFLCDNNTRYSWINSSSLESNSQFELVGIMLGLALYNGVIINLSFPPLMYKKLLKEKVVLEDIEMAFPDLGKGLRQLLEWSEGDVADVFMRTFEISYEHYGKIIHIPLIANGSETLVTNSNRHEYVKLYIKHLVDTSIEYQFQAFQKGFYRVCGGRPLAMCRPHELELLICGIETDETAFHKLEEGATYDDGYSASHSVIKWFWEIVHAMSLSHKRMLLEFVTASDRVPLKGLESLTFVIQRNGPDTDRLPSALTCFGRLLLPEYSSKEKLQERLLTAVENAKGFGLV